MNSWGKVISPCLEDYNNNDDDDNDDNNNNNIQKVQWTQKCSWKRNFKVLWDFIIQCDHMTEVRTPNIVVFDKIKKETMIIDVAIPGDTRVYVIKNEKRSRNIAC